MIELPQIQELQASQELQELQASLVLQGLHAGNLLRESRSHLEDTTPKEKNSVRRKVG